MYSFVNRFRNYVWLKSLAYIIFGLMFLFEPHETLNAFIGILAVFFAIFGIINLLSAWRQRARAEITSYSLSIGISQLVIAVIIWIFAKPLLAFLPFVVGLTLVIMGISKTIDGLQQHREYVNVSPFPNSLYGMILTLLGIMLMFNPFGTVLVVLQFFGAILVIMSVMDIVLAWRWR
ncbi:membrane protein [Lentilactobacillus fungorum]|uniref:Membrane protein n=1 Tax=Lentilactobacillus fungorum TaxID=2201250 RepID=A0ABQ3W0S2_9LACO|nr:DUF308 domain-containing protein [Lentilactobacillus fungorum]GHP13871.1 membrane protein [Lentilactobacillus fungorum]